MCLGFLCPGIAIWGYGKDLCCGVRRNEAINTNTVSGGPKHLIFGAEWPDGAVAYQGILDDVRMWDYPVDPITIGLMYTDFNSGVNVCIEQDDP